MTQIPKVALITGITGQDGAYLTELLLHKGYVVHGLKRRASTIHNTSRIDHIFHNEEYKNRFFLHYSDLTDAVSLSRLIQEIKPDEVYNLGAQSHVQVSFEMPLYTADADALGTLRLLEAIKSANLIGKTKFYQASSSEMFGKVVEVPQTETTPFYPRSPYAVAKVFSFWIVKNYREAYGMFACNGILFNHESPLRGETFVTRKITRAIALQYHGQPIVLRLGNLYAKRDWGYAKEFVEAMWRMLQHEKPDDWVIATGNTYTVKEFVEKAYAYIGITIEWAGSELNEKGYNAQTGQLMVCVDPRYFRPAEVDLLIGDSSKARQELGWQATTTLDELVAIMMDADINNIKHELLASGNKPIPSLLNHYRNAQQEQI